MSWLSGWSNRKPITLSRATGAVTNYQMKLLVGESAGSGTNDVLATGCKTDFSDLRFTASDGITLLNYWIEEVTGTTPNQVATIWIKFDSIGTGATTFYMYYGNAGASASSDGAATFILFDDFAGGSLDSAKWDTAGTVTVTTGEDGGSSVKLVVNDTGDNAGIKSKVDLSSCSMRGNVKFGSQTYGIFWLKGATYMDFSYEPASSKAQSYINAGNFQNTSCAIDGSAYHTYEMSYLNGVSQQFLVDGSSIATHSAPALTGTDFRASLMGFKYPSVAPELYADWILVRQYVATEPAWGSWGGEEEVPAVPFISGWTYRKPVILSRSVGAVTNYQMKLQISEAYASPSGTTKFALDTDGTLKTDLKAYFCLDGNSGDNSSNGNAGTNTDISYDYAYGKANRGALFNGSTSRIQCEDSASLTLGGSFSIAVWVYPHALPASGSLVSLISKYDAISGSGGYNLDLNNDSGTYKIGLTTAGGGTDGGDRVAYALPLNAWSFIVAIYDGAYSKIYVDNEFIGQAANTCTPGNNTKKLNVGNFGYYSPTSSELGRYFDGCLDEVGLWQKVLSTQEMTDLYNGGKGNSIVNYDVDCNAFCKSDFSDLRFAKADGAALLDYWIESVSGTTPNQLATVWIEFDSIGTGDTTFYMYYGNAGASSVSSGVDTFLFFDDFERGVDGDFAANNWLYDGTPKLSTEQALSGTRSMKSTSAASAWRASPAVSNDIAVRVNLYKPTASREALMVYKGGNAKVAYLNINENEDVLYHHGDGDDGDTGYDIIADTWGLFELCNFNWSTGVYDIYYNGTKIGDTVPMWNQNYGANDEYDLWTGLGSFYSDNFLVRNWRATEPTFGSWGSQEIKASPTSPFPGGRLI